MRVLRIGGSVAERRLGQCGAVAKLRQQRSGGAVAGRWRAEAGRKRRNGGAVVEHSSGAWAEQRRRRRSGDKTVTDQQRGSDGRRRFGVGETMAAQWRSNCGAVALVGAVAEQWRSSGRSVAEHWRSIGGAVAGGGGSVAEQWRSSGGAVALVGSVAEQWRSSGGALAEKNHVCELIRALWGLRDVHSHCSSFLFFGIE